MLVNFVWIIIQSAIVAWVIWLNTSQPIADRVPLGAAALSGILLAFCITIATLWIIALPRRILRIAQWYRAAVNHGPPAPRQARHQLVSEVSSGRR